MKAGLVTLNDCRIEADHPMHLWHELSDIVGTQRWCNGRGPFIENIIRKIIREEMDKDMRGPERGTAPDPLAVCDGKCEGALGWDDKRVTYRDHSDRERCRGCEKLVLS